MPAALAAIEAAYAAGRYVAGYFSYELGYALEARLLPLLPAARVLPLLWFGIFEAPETFDGARLDAVAEGLAPLFLGHPFPEGEAAQVLVLEIHM